MVSKFKNVGERYIANNYRPVSPLSVAKKPANNSLVNYLEKCLPSDFQYVFRSFRLTADLLSVVSNKIAWGLIFGLISSE